jgi:hypothetical protein
MSFWAIVAASILFLYIFSTNTTKTTEIVPNAVEQHVESGTDEYSEDSIVDVECQSHDSIVTLGTQHHDQHINKK